jgi:RNA polymerase-binding transcription factor DksA
MTTLHREATRSVAVDPDAVRAALSTLLSEAVSSAGELKAELDRLRPVLVREPSTETDYIAAMRRLTAAEQTAVEVKSALQRLDDGSYGVCVSCQEPIPAARLELRPQALQCVRCS